MKNISLILLLMLGFLSQSISQVPTKATDISPLLISEKIPAVDLTSTDGVTVNTLDLVKSKPTLFLFYRGGWCPYCNAHLSEVGKVEDQILALGYQVVAVSPDSPENLKKTVEKNDVKYNLYSDASGAFIKGLGIAFQAPERYSDMLSTFSDELNPGLLPVPSLFIVETDGTISFEYISPDYKNRVSSDLVLDVLKRLKEESEE